MKTHPNLTLFAGIGFLLATPSLTHGQMVVHTVNNLNLAIPDVPGAGASSTFTMTTAFTLIQSVRVDLLLEATPATWTSDYFAYVQHEDIHGAVAIAVLLNRVGRAADNLDGYTDNGFNVTFSDTAPRGDVHDYRFALSGSHTTELASPGVVTGTWQPDGREKDPATVLRSDSRTAMLSSFQGMDPNGSWKLYVSDEAEGGSARITSWGVTVTAVPEPATAGLLAGLGLLAWTAWRRRH